MRPGARWWVVGLAVVGPALMMAGCNDSELPTEPEAPTAQVTVGVEATCAGVVPGVDVLLDGEPVGHVRAGDTLAFVVTGAGEHELLLRAADGREWRVTLGMIAAGGGGGRRSGFWVSLACTASGARVTVSEV